MNRTSQEMREQFEKNGKDIDSDKVQSIIDNTVIFFEEMQTKYREIIDYYVVNAKHRLKGVKAFGDICRELGYIDGSYEGDWSDELKEQVSTKLSEVAMEEPEKFNRIIKIAGDSNLLETTGAWIVEEIENLYKE